MWSNAVLIAGVGFGVVFVVLTLLMAAMRIAGAVLSSEAVSSKNAQKTEPTK